MSKQDTESRNKKSAADLEDLQRRQLITKAAKLAAYTTPTITALTLAPSVHGFQSPPNPPTVDQSADYPTQGPPPKRG